MTEPHYPNRLLLIAALTAMSWLLVIGLAWAVAFLVRSFGGQ